MLQIGFCIYRASDPPSHLGPNHFMYTYDCCTSGPYINYREVFGRFELSSGSYVVIPATFETGAPSNFMMRVYAENEMELKEMK